MVTIEHSYKKVTEMSGYTKQDRVRNEIITVKVQELSYRKYDKLSSQVVWTYVEKSYRSTGKKDRA